MSHNTIAKTQQSLNKLKKLQFGVYIKNVNSKLEFRSWLSHIKFNHYDCSYSCWAYRILENRKN